MNSAFNFVVKVVVLTWAGCYVYDNFAPRVKETFAKRTKN